MDLFNDKPPKASVKQKLLTGDVFKASLVTIDKQNGALSKIKARHCSPSPSFSRKSEATETSISMRAQSAERKRPPFTTSLKSSSAPSSPLRRPSFPLPPNSKPSTPPSSVCNGIVDKQNSSRLAFGGRATDGLWPTMRSLSSSFNSEPFVFANKDRPLRSASLDHMLKGTTKVKSERKRNPLTGRNTSEQSENSSLVQGAHSRVVDQHRWPAMKGGKASTMAFSRSTNLTDQIEKAASLMLRSRGLSPNRRIVNATSPHLEEEKVLFSTNPSRASSSSPNNASVLSSFASKGTASPSSSRPSSPFMTSNNAMNQIGTSSPVLRHILDVRKGCKEADMEDIHQLRLLYNKELQWRFVNSQAKVSLTSQKISAENICSNVWNVISELQDSVTMEKINVESLKKEMKLEILLKEQAPYLDDWIALKAEYSTALFGTTEALKASMLRLPVTGGVRVDLRSVKNAVSSAMDIMQAMGSSVCSLLSKVVDIKRLLCQLSALAAEEKSMLDECRVLLAATAGMQVEECSLRAHILQLP